MDVRYQMLKGGRRGRKSHLPTWTPVLRLWLLTHPRIIGEVPLPHSDWLGHWCPESGPRTSWLAPLSARTMETCPLSAGHRRQTSHKDVLWLLLLGPGDAQIMGNRPQSLWTRSKLYARYSRAKRSLSALWGNNQSSVSDTAAMGTSFEPLFIVKTKHQAWNKCIFFIFTILRLSLASPLHSKINNFCV